MTDEKAELVYNQTCLFAIELTAKAARTLIEEHRSIEQTLQERVGYSDEQPGVGAGKMFDPSTCVLTSSFAFRASTSR